MVCVKGETIARFGPPGEVFTEGGDQLAYDLEQGAYNEDFAASSCPCHRRAARFRRLRRGTGIAGLPRRLHRRIPLRPGIYLPMISIRRGTASGRQDAFAARPSGRSRGDSGRGEGARGPREAVIDAGRNRRGQRRLGMLSYAGAGKRINAGSIFTAGGDAMKELREGFTTGKLCRGGGAGVSLWQREGACPRGSPCVPGGKEYSHEIHPP